MRAWIRILTVAGVTAAMAAFADNDPTIAGFTIEPSIIVGRTVDQATATIQLSGDHPGTILVYLTDTSPERYLVYEYDTLSFPPGETSRNTTVWAGLVTEDTTVTAVARIVPSGNPVMTDVLVKKIYRSFEIRPQVIDSAGIRIARGLLTLKYPARGSLTMLFPTVPMDSLRMEFPDPDGNVFRPGQSEMHILLRGWDETEDTSVTVIAQPPEFQRPTIQATVFVTTRQLCSDDFCVPLCRGSDSTTLPVINEDGVESSPDQAELYGCSTPSEPVCNAAAVTIDGDQCNDPCLEDDTCIEELGDSHEPDQCYGACGAGCGGCCTQWQALCRPPNFWLDKGINPGTGLPYGCTFVEDLAGGYKRVVCGLTGFGYFNLSKDLVDLGVPQLAYAYRTRMQSHNSLGACPGQDWRSTTLRSFVDQGTGIETFTRRQADPVPEHATVYEWVGTPIFAQACSVHPLCYQHDECNRHDVSKYLDCQLWGIAQGGVSAVVGTPTVNFSYGWWERDGNARVRGDQFQNPESKNLIPDQSRDPKVDCFYDFNPVGRTMVLSPPPWPWGLEYNPHVDEQAICPMHLRKHHFWVP